MHADQEFFEVSTNATEYYVSFTNDVRLGSAVLNFSVVLNETFWDSPVDQIYVQLAGDSTILDILGLQSDGLDSQRIETVSLSELNGEVGFSIYYTMFPSDSITYPYDFSLTITVLVIGLASGNNNINNDVTRSIHGRINLPLGKITLSFQCLQMVQCEYTMSSISLVYIACNLPLFESNGV